MGFEAGLQKLEEMSAKVSSEAAQQLSQLFDGGSFCELDKFTTNGDAKCDVVTAYGYINGVLSFAFAQNKGTDGAVGKVFAAKVKKLYETAAKVGAPVISIFNNDGAHIDEGADAMEAYSDILSSSAALSGVVPQISIVAGNCTGTSAVLAAMSDIVIMLKDAEMYVTAGSILKNEKVGTSELAANNGTAAYIAEDIEDAFTKAQELITYIPQNNLSVPLFAEYNPSCCELNGNGAYEVINAVCDADSFCELYKDFAKCVVVGFARINGGSVGIIATDNGGDKICADGASEAARFIRFCDAFSIPIITFLNAEGILGNEGDEISGGVKYAAQLTHAYAEATTPKITVITGAACGSAYIAFAGKGSGIDSVFAWPNAYVSAMVPDAAVEFLKKSELSDGKTREELKTEYRENEASVFSAAAKGLIEDVIDPYETASKLATALDMLAGKRVSTMDKKHSNIQL